MSMLAARFGGFRRLALVRALAIAVMAPLAMTTVVGCEQEESDEEEVMLDEEDEASADQAILSMEQDAVEANSENVGR